MTSTLTNIIKSFTNSKQKKVLLANCLRAFFRGGIGGVKSYLSGRYISKQAVGGFGINYALRDLLITTRKIQILAEDNDLVEQLQKLFTNVSLATILIRNRQEINADLPLLVINPQFELNHRNSIAYFTVELPTFDLTNYRYFWLENPAQVSVLQDNHAIKFQQIYVLKFNLPYLVDSIINDPQYYFYRFALACGIISYSQFWNFTHEMITLTSSQLCLSLPEQQFRRNDFIYDTKNYSFALFDGLRHELGWVGCGLSYKYLFCLAKKHNLPYLIICEDDVEFFANFSLQLQQINAFLNAINYHIFSGLIADLNPLAKIRQLYLFNNQQFIELDKMTSMVFNIYHSLIYNHVIDWDETNLDRDINAIDRYIENLPNLKIITTLPFLVGHKEEHNSTVWGVQNTHYCDIIAESAKRLQEKINDYEKDKL